MVGVAVGAQNRRQYQAVGFDEFQRRRGLAGIDQCDVGVVMDGPDVVVLQGGDSVDG